MISISSVQILPISDDKVFEEMVCEIFNSIEKTTSFDLYGRSGQKQNGIDIYSLEKKIAIQCKHKLIISSDKIIREELIKDLNFEFDQFIKYNKTIDNFYTKFIFTTTFKNDTALVKRCQELTAKFNFNIEYWHWNKLTNNLDSKIVEKYLPQIFSENLNYYQDDNLKSSEINIDRNLPFIEQIEQYFRILFDEIKILHSDFFLNQYPFKNKKNSTYRTFFTIHSNNEALTSFFDSFDINAGEIQMKNQNTLEKSKVEFILKTLNENSILYFSNRDKNFIKNLAANIVPIETYYKKYDQFKFIEGLNSIPRLKKEDSIDDFMHLGYFYYKIGNLIKSIEIFKKTKAKAILEHKGIYTFICDHNLYHLGRLVHSRYWDLPNKEEIVKELLDINLNKIYSKNLHIPFYNFISSRNFFNEARIKIQSLSNKILDKYDLFLRGGANSTNYEWEILYEYSVLNSFLTKNYIIYDCYLEYKELFQTFFESFLASYSIKNGSDRTLFIDDFYLNHALEYLDTKGIESLFLKYNIFTLKYEDDATHSYRFLTLFENIISNDFIQMQSYLLKDQNNGTDFGNYFWSNRDRLIQNFVYLSGIIDFDLNSTHKICALIIKYINIDKQNLNSDYLIKFIIQKIAIISTQNLKLFFKFIIRNKDFYSTYSLERLCSILKKNNKIINFSIIEFESIIEKLIYFQGSEFKYVDSISIYGIVKKDFQLIIKNKILKELDKNFVFEIYYYCVTYDLISYNYNNYFDDYLKNFNLNHHRVVDNNLFNTNGSTKRYLVIDEILNIAFKFQLDIDNMKFDVFRGISNYYDWILNIKNYNYENFDPYWINMYHTDFYDSYFRKYDNLKKEILKAINSNDDNRLRKIYYRIYTL